MGKDVVIVGAGISGVMAAQTLHKKGIENVLLVDKRRSVGGRLATRRIEAGRVDLGAQFLTCRMPRFKELVNEWEQAGLIKHWFGNEHPRYKSNDGLNQLVKKLAENQKTLLNTRISSIKRLNNGYQLLSDTDQTIEAMGVILTPPAPQTLSILNRSEINTAVKEQLEDIQFNPCMVLILLLNRETALPKNGLLREGLPEGIERIVDHKKKGISQLDTICVYTTGKWAKDNFDGEEAKLTNELLNKVNGYFPEDSIKQVQLKKWRYSEALTYVRKPFLDSGEKAPLLIAGDIFLHEEDPAERTRIESAALSGITVGEEMATRIK